jgi:hypothetical protein
MHLHAGEEAIPTEVVLSKPRHNFHIPPDLVVTSGVIHDCLDISKCYPNRVLSGDETR